MVKTLHVPYEKVLKLESKLNIRLSFEEITLLTLVISFNKTDIGYCATNEQLADFLRCSKRKAQAVKKSLIKNKLVTEIRRGNNSTILKPVKKAVSILCYPVSKNSSTQVARDARNTLSKDREYSNNITTSSFRDDAEWKKAYEKYKKDYGPKYAEEKANQYLNNLKLKSI